MPAGELSNLAQSLTTLTHLKTLYLRKSDPNTGVEYNRCVPGVCELLRAVPSSSITQVDISQLVEDEQLLVAVGDMLTRKSSLSALSTRAGLGLVGESGGSGKFLRFSSLPPPSSTTPS